MNAIIPMKSPRLKLARASKHIDALEESISLFFQGDWYSCDFAQTESGNYSLRVEVHGEPGDFGLILGDAVHNLRAALDLMAVEVVRAYGGNTSGVYFPFADGADSLDQMIKKRNFHRAPEKAQNKVRALKPYAGGNAMLRALHDLDIQDKHHTVIPNAGLITSPAVRVKTGPNGAPLGFGEGQLLLEVEPDSAPTIVFQFPDNSLFAKQEVVPTLRTLHQLVTAIVDDFQEAL